MPPLRLLSRRRLRIRRTRGAAALLLALLLTPVVARAQSNQSLLQQRPGLFRNVTNDLQFLLEGFAGARSALLSVFGVVSDPTQLDKDQAQNALVYKYYKNPEDVATLQAMAVASAYLPPELDSAASDSGGTGVEPGAPGPDGQTAEGPCDRITDWADFLVNCASISKQMGVGRVLLLREAFSSTAANQNAALAATTIAGQGIQPEFLAESTLKGAAAGAVIPAFTNAIGVPLAVVLSGWRLATELIPLARYTTAAFTATDLDVKGTDLNASTAGPSASPHPKITYRAPDGKTERESEIPVAVTGLNARTPEQSALAREAAAAAGSSLANVQNGLQPFFQGSRLGQAQQYFGPGNTNLYQSLLGGDRFASLLGGLFGGGTGGSPPPQPNGATLPPSPTCDPSSAALASNQAVDLAQLLGVPVSPTGPWEVALRSPGALTGIQGYNPETGSLATIGPTNFTPADRCVWVAAAAPVAGFRSTAFVSDTTDPAGSEFVLLIPEGTRL